MNIKHMLYFIIFTAALAGCATTKMTAELQQEANTPLYCNNEAECKVMWERAAFFISENSVLKLQMYNDVTIQTYNPPPNSPYIAIRFQREPLGNGKYRIWTSAWCGSIFGDCYPNNVDVTIAKAKRYMRTGQK